MKCPPRILFSSSFAALLLSQAGSAYANLGDLYGNLRLIDIEIATPQFSGPPGSLFVVRGSVTNRTSSTLGPGLGTAGWTDATCTGNGPQCIVLGTGGAFGNGTFGPFETTGVIDLHTVRLNDRYAGPFPGVVNFTRTVSIGTPMLNPPNPVFGESSRYSITVVQPAVPEPSTLLLGAAGLLAAIAARRRPVKPR